MNEVDSKLTKLQLLEERKKLRDELPHLYGFKLYSWMRDFLESRNSVNVLCSANQIGKTSIQIRKAILWATDKSLWPHLWKTRPYQFWYLYPSASVATVEFEKKWITEFLPRGTKKDDLIYGWRDEYKGNFIQAIHFKSDVSIYFKTYSQDPQDLQSGSCSSIFTDEELPENLYSELQFRLAATEGYFHAVFTPTLGQEFWREAIEVRGYKERFPNGFKRQVSMYDCLKYEDGSPSFWTEERIERIKNACKSEAEIQRRIYGKFVLDSGLKYPSFSRTKNIIRPFPVPRDYRIFIGVDSGSGGDNHPAAVTFVAVAPDYKKGFVFLGRRFDNQVTTNADIVQSVQQMRGSLEVDAIFYDHAATDMRQIAARMGESWVPAEKSHAIGEQVLNVLFKNEMLKIFDTEELDPLAMEFGSLKQSTPKNMAKDDYADSCRYAVSKIPWDWSAIQGEKLVPLVEKSEQDIRREYWKEKEDNTQSIEDEIESWNELHEFY